MLKKDILGLGIAHYAYYTHKYTKTQNTVKYSIFSVVLNKRDVSSEKNTVQYFPRVYLKDNLATTTATFIHTCIHAQTLPSVNWRHEVRT